MSQKNQTERRVKFAISRQAASQNATSNSAGLRRALDASKKENDWLKERMGNMGLRLHQLLCEREQFLHWAYANRMGEPLMSRSSQPRELQEPRQAERPKTITQQHQASSKSWADVVKCKDRVVQREDQAPSKTQTPKMNCANVIKGKDRVQKQVIQRKDQAPSQTQTSPMIIMDEEQLIQRELMMSNLKLENESLKQDKNKMAEKAKQLEEMLQQVQQQQINPLVEHINHMNGLIKKLEAEKAQLKSEMEEKATLQLIQRENQAPSQAETSTMNWGDMMEDHDELQQKLLEKDQMIKDLTLENKSLSEMLRENNNLQRLEDQEEKEAQIKVMEDQVKSLQEKNHQLQEDKNKLAEKAKQLEKTMQHVQQQNDPLEKRINHMSGLIKKLEAEKAKHLEGTMELVQQNDFLRGRGKSMNGLIKELHAEKAQFKREMEGKSKHLEETLQNNNFLKGRNIHLDGLVQKLHAEKAKFKDQTQRIISLEYRLQENSRINQEMEKNINILQGQVCIKEQEVHRLNAINQSLSATLFNVEEQLRETKTELEKNAEQKTEMLQNQKDNEDSNKVLQQKIRDLEQKQQSKVEQKKSLWSWLKPTKKSDRTVEEAAGGSV